MIVFKKIRYKNFLSSGNVFTEYDLNSNKNTLIIGKNGSGKSTLLDALTFALFGKAYRNINKPSLVNTINQKDCMVELEFTIGNKSHFIRRGLKPNVFDVVVDGMELDKMASAKDFQNNLENNTLKMNYKSFCSVVILGARYDSFMNMTPADRRKVVEDVLDIEIFSEMNVVLKDRLAKLKESIRDNNSNIQLNEEKKELQILNMAATMKERQEDIDKKTEQLQTIQNAVAKETRLLVDEKALHKKLSTEIDKVRGPVEKKKKNADDIFRDLNKNRTKVAKEHQFFEGHDTCPTCEQEIEEQFRNHMISTKENKASELDSAIRSLTETITNIDKELEDVRALEIKYEEQRNKLTTHETDILMGIKQVKSLNDEIDTLNSRQEDTHEGDRAKVLEDIECQIVDLMDDKVELMSKKKSHDVAYDLLKDSGIKSKIIENYLPIINAQINQHLRDLDFYVKFELDETFNETIKSRHLDEFTYDSFSEGEKARIDLALLFTWRKIAELKNSVSTNLLILDEVFDGSLDAIGADEVMAKLLFNRSEHFNGEIRDTQKDNTNVFVISHKIDLVDKFEDTIKFEKVKGFSRKS